MAKFENAINNDYDFLGLTDEAEKMTSNEVNTNEIAAGDVAENDFSSAEVFMREMKVESKFVKKMNKKYKKRMRKLKHETKSNKKAIKKNKKHINDLYSNQEVLSEEIQALQIDVNVLKKEAYNKKIAQLINSESTVERKQLVNELLAWRD
jgi:hypothetical protein